MGHETPGHAHEKSLKIGEKFFGIVCLLVGMMERRLVLLFLCVGDCCLQSFWPR